MNDELKKIDFNLFLASYNGNLEQIKLYASLKGNINFALAGAVYGSHLQLVLYLLNNGATDASGCLYYAKDIRIAYILSKHSDFFNITKFIKNLFLNNVSKFYPFYPLYGYNKNEIVIDNVPMRIDTEYLHEIINRSDENALITYAHRCSDYELMSVLLKSIKNIDLFFLDNGNFLGCVKKFENIPNFIFAAEKYLRNNVISIQKIDALNEYSPLSSCLARHYIKHNKTHTALGRKKYRFNKIYKKYIKYDPVFIILTASYSKENKLLYQVPIDIFRTINSYF